MAVTRSDVARTAGVSPAVVSFVVNNGPGAVAPSTRARVEEAIARLDYRPNAIASALRGGTTQSVGLLIPNPRDPFSAELAEQIKSAFSAAGYLVLTGNTYFDRAREERFVRTFVDRRVDALLFAPGVSVARDWHDRADGPIAVFIGGDESEGRESRVRTDDAADAVRAVEHLQRHGHRFIGCIAGPPNLPLEAARVAGWRQQQQNNGSPAGDELIAYADLSEQGGYTAARLLLSEHGRPWAVHDHRPTAVFFTSDAQAIGALFACFELGLRVPQDVAIVSFGGTEPASYTLPPLTTLRQDVGYLAAQAAKTVLARLGGETDLKTPSRPITGNLVIGQSCGCPHGDPRRSAT